MQNSRSATVEGWLKVQLLSGAIIMLLVVGLHPVHVFADADNSDSSDSSATTVAAAADTTTNPTVTSSGQTDPTDTSSSDTQQPVSSSADGSDDTSGVDDTPPSPTPTPSDTINTQSDDSAATITNQTTSTGESGDASVSGSTTGGSATSGDAQTIATALNILSSSTDVRNNNVNTSVTNVAGNGNNQNVVIDPATITDGSTDPQDASNTEINSASSGTIDNNLTLGATSGDATVADNTTAGNATSGDATAEADIVNITNSDLNSGQYYIGVINIYGDFSGNILLSPKFVSQLLSENPTLLDGDTGATNTVNQTINNEINATATSGDAAVANNFLGGNATSGDATTSIDSFNLINGDITGNNALLVFINVLGTWEGVIIGGPAGSTTATYGDAISEDAAPTPTTDSQATLASATTNEEIDNNINATATSGDATVADNTTAGNATSGDAVVSINLLNILSSDVSLTGWFGVLFINVFGDWSGDFGVIQPVATTTAAPGGSVTTGPDEHLASLGESIAQEVYTIFDQSGISTPTPGQVLGATTSVVTTKAPLNFPSARTVASTDRGSRTWWLPAVAGMILASATLGLEQILRRRQQQNR